MTSIRKSPARLEVLEAASAGKLEWRSNGSIGGFYVLDGRYLHPERLVCSLIDVRALKHKIPGVPRRTGPVEITETGSALLAKWQG